MATRNLLSMSRIPEFREWMTKQGFNEVQVPSESTWEVARFRKGTQLVIIFQRARTIAGQKIMHASVQDKDAALVRQFIKETADA